MGGPDSWIPNPLKHTEAEPVILTATGPDMTELEGQLLQYEYEKIRVSGSQNKSGQIADKLERQNRIIELAKHIKIECSVEQPHGFETIQGARKEPEYDSGPLRVVFKIEENGKSRKFETTANVLYEDIPRAPQVVRGPLKIAADKPNYVMRIGLSGMPFEGDGEDTHLKNKLAWDVFQKAMARRQAAENISN